MTTKPRRTSSFPKGLRKYKKSKQHLDRSCASISIQSTSCIHKKSYNSTHLGTNRLCSRSQKTTTRRIDRRNDEKKREAEQKEEEEDTNYHGICQGSQKTNYSKAKKRINSILFLLNSCALILAYLFICGSHFIFEFYAIMLRGLNQKKSKKISFFSLLEIKKVIESISKQYLYLTLSHLLS